MTVGKESELPGEEAMAYGCIVGASNELGYSAKFDGPCIRS